MWAVTSYYNPAGFKRRLANYKVFRANLAVPLLTVELSFNGHFELTKNDADILIQISGGAVLWQKERLLNFAFKSVPPEVEKIAWIDCDIVFDRADWMVEAARQLDRYNIVQPFSELVELEPEGHHSNFRERGTTGRSLVSLINGDARVQLEAKTPREGLETSTRQTRATPVGIAWAARRAILENHGLYDAMIIGGADRAMLYAIYGQFEREIERHCLSKSHREHYLKWARPFHRTIAQKISYVPGRIYHLWHGNLVNRKYSTRHRLLADFGFEPDADLVKGPNGAWQWARPRGELERVLANYFVERAEDE